MCGVYGFFGSELDNPVETLAKMGKTLNHRGPDNTGIFILGENKSSVALGHKRLSIIDLDNRSNQPLSSEDGNYIIVYNGEIYNFQELRDKVKGYRFSTNSDTEVIIALYSKYGIDSTLQLLNGIFAFVIYDKINKKLIMARDRHGVKPLFYKKLPNHIVFSSEITAITRFPGSTNKINNLSLELFLSLKFIPGDLTIYDEVYKLEAGQYIVTDSSLILNKTHYYRFQNLEYDHSSSKFIDNEIVQSVQRNMISDVEVVSLLSSGIDSSLVTLIAHQHNVNLQTYTIGLEDVVRDESIDANEFAKKIGIKNKIIKINDDMIIDCLLDINNIIDEPLGDPSIILTYLITNEIRKDGIKVILSGDGGDEFFYGYSNYNLIDNAYKKFQLLNPLYNLISKIVNISSNRLIGYVLNIMKNNVMFIYGFNSGYSGYYSHVALKYNKKESLKIIEEFFSEKLNLENRSIKEYQNKFDKQFYLTDDILVKLDRASMRNSIESRVPLLDYTLTELAEKVSPNVHLEKGNKTILKRFLSRLSFDYVNKKKGFSFDITRILNHKLVKSKIMKYIEIDYLEEQDIFNINKTRNIINAFYKTNKSANFVWNFLIFQLWHEGNLRKIVD